MCSLCGIKKDLHYEANNGILHYKFCLYCWEFLKEIVLLKEGEVLNWCNLFTGTHHFDAPADDGNFVCLKCWTYEGYEMEEV